MDGASADGDVGPGGGVAATPDASREPSPAGEPDPSREPDPSGEPGQPPIRNLRRLCDDEDDLEDLRIAVVMSGGVSLAVWIGGVARELNRLTESQPAEGAADPYAALLDVTGTTARVDVIAGTSAGGLNGAFLALATVYGSSLGPLGDLWADKGAFTELLRSPLQGEPPSLLRGDEYFLPELVGALGRIHRVGAGYRRPADHPVDLMITTSLMNGAPRTTVDAFGTELHEVEHHGLFRFRRTTRTTRADDPFAGEHVIAQLGLAARSTASFPFAFEASYIPIGPERATVERPDMASVANFGRSGFVLDGGVLVNRPVGLALRAIFEQPAERQVRRALAYIDPNPAGSAPYEHQEQDDAPTVREVMTDSLLTLPRAQSIARELAELEQHNRDVADRRQVRSHLDQLAGADPDERRGLAASLYSSYRERRIQRASAYLLRVADRQGLFDTPTPSALAGSDGVPAWSRAEFTSAFGRAAARDELPFVPPVASLATATPSAAEPWRFGLATAERLAFVALDVLQRAMWVTPVTEHDLRRQLRAARGEVHGWVELLRGLRADDGTFWSAAFTRLPRPPAVSSRRNEELTGWLRRTASQWPVLDPADDGRRSPEAARSREVAVAEAAEARHEARLALESVVWKLVEILRDRRAVLGAAVDAGAGSPVPRMHEEAAALGRLLALILPPPTAATTDHAQAEAAQRDADAIMERLTILEVLHLLFAPQTEVEQSVDLMQISGWTPNTFGGPASPSTKLAGAKLGHFGAFYKHSWRVNDWIWGRLDGATRACQLVLSPDRLRQLDFPVAEAVAAVEAAALGPATADPHDAADRAWLASRFDASGCAEELAYLDDVDLPVPPSLPRCAAAIARRVHLGILREELPKLIAAVGTDEAAGALRQSRGAELRARYQAAAEHAGPDRPIPAAALVEMFAGCGLGDETVADDAGSDLFAETVSAASLVGVSVVHAPTSGFGPARAIARSMRGLLLVMYALVIGSVRGSRFGNFAVAAALAAGGALLAVGFLVDRAPALVGNLGAVLVLGGITTAAVRSRVWPFVLFVGAPLLALVIATAATTTWSAVLDGLGNVVVVVGVVLLALAVGTLKMRERPPWPVDGAGGRARRIGLPWAAGAVALVLLVVVDAVWPDPPSVVRFEFVLTLEAGERLLAGWGPEQYAAAIRSTAIDVAALAIYWLPIAAVNGWVARRLTRDGWRGRRAARWVRHAILATSLALTAAVLDLIENVGIVLLLQTARTAEPTGSLAAAPAVLPAGVTVAATLKFLFLGVATFYGLVWCALLGAERRGWIRPRPDPDADPDAGGASDGGQQPAGDTAA